MAKIPDFYVGDEGFNIVRTLYRMKEDGSWGLFDLTSWTVYFAFVKPSGTTVAEQTATVPTPANGKAYYVLPNGLLSEAGQYVLQIRAQKGTEHCHGKTYFEVGSLGL